MADSFLCKFYPFNRCHGVPTSFLQKFLLIFCIAQSLHISSISLTLLECKFFGLCVYFSPLCISRPHLSQMIISFFMTSHLVHQTISSSAAVTLQPVSLS